jgi:hypothetical protein
MRAHKLLRALSVSLAGISLGFGCVGEPPPPSSGGSSTSTSSTSSSTSSGGSSSTSSSGGSSSSSGGVDPIDDACNAYRDAYKVFGQKCGDGTDGLLGTDEFAAYCKALLRAPGLPQDFAPAIARCAAKIGTANCDFSVSETPECAAAQNVGNGTLNVNTPCGSDAQCSMGSCRGADINLNSVTCGKCTATAALNQSCANADCGKGLACVSSICNAIAEVDVNGACGTATTQCKPGLACVSRVCKATKTLNENCTQEDRCKGALVCASGTCAVRAKVNESCDTERSCAQGLRCVQRTCRDLRVGVAQGCGGPAAVLCKPGLDCNSTTSTCVRIPKAGEMCLPDAGPSRQRCDLWLTCKADQCEVLDLGVCR